MAEDTRKPAPKSKPRPERENRSRDSDRSEPAKDQDKPVVFTDWAAI